MKLQNLSTRTFVRLIVEGASLTTILLLFLLYVFTKDIRVILGGFSVMILLFFWGVIFLHYFQKKLSVFTDGLCRTLDEMMDSTVRPQINYEAETLLARISHRLERLYHVMQETRHKVEEEKAELQSLVSDISHQTKTPIANLKMLNDTMLARNISEETREEFLHATASQLDKLDFLIQGMVKTSRLETGVITLEKKETVIADTLVDAINGVLAPMERKHLHLSVDCPENLTVSHDSRWTSEALFNLLDNAVKYTPEGGDIHVTVQDWEMYLEIAVTDTGRGIPESVQATIFKRFYREEAVHDVDGIGIGLGDEISLEIGEKKIQVKVMGIVDANIPYGGYDTLFIPLEMLDTITPVENFNYQLIIDTDDNEWDILKEEIQKMISPNARLYISTFNDWVEAYNEKLLNYRMPVYVFVMFIGVFGIINLLNTLITNVLTRKRELGVLQAVGLSGKQLSNMLLMEGLFYTICVLILSILFGTVLGYLLCTVFSSMSIFGRVTYHFPIVEMFIYFILMFVVQTLFSRLTIKQIKKQSLVEQVREL